MFLFFSESQIYGETEKQVVGTSRASTDSFSFGKQSAMELIGEIFDNLTNF